MGREAKKEGGGEEGVVKEGAVVEERGREVVVVWGALRGISADAEIEGRARESERDREREREREGERE